jgi:peptidoglycan/LPS O-acetylase OafA/YrhL
VIHREISEKKYQIDSLDGLRGFAALIVVFSHTSNEGMYFLPYLNLAGTGKSGVFLFFLLSSFLLTLPLLRFGNKVFTLQTMSHYWQRRFFRIYPLYTLYLLLGVISTLIIYTFLEKENIGIPFSLNWQEFFGHIFLMEGKEVTWSIAVEFKFYFILPFLVLIIAYIRQFRFFVVILFFIGLLIISQIISPQAESLKNDSRLLPYMPIFIIGIFLAVIQNKINSKHNQAEKYTKLIRTLGYVGIIGVLLMTPLVFSFFTGEINQAYFHKQFILYAVFWSLILLSSVNVKGIIQNVFSLPILRFYGSLSFSLYLFHPIFIKITKHIDMNQYLAFWSVLLPATLTAYISFKALEEPISKYKTKRSHFLFFKKLVSDKAN